MPLQRRWRDLDRETVGSAPNGYAVVEFGTDGTVERVEAGVVRDLLKDALAYGGHEQVRWKPTQHRDHAERLAEDHRGRL